MNSTVYDFFYEGDAYLGLFGLALAVSVGVLAFVGVFLPRCTVEINGEKKQIKTLGILPRLLIQGIPAGVSLLLAVLCAVNCFQYLQFAYAYCVGDYAEVSGELNAIVITRNDSREEELYDIEFQIGDVVFSTQNSYTAAQKAYFTEDRTVTVQYGYLGREMMIYRIIVCANDDG
ncbi:MAG: hypothetical protein IJ448_04070 [Oscillospiraceae bacterium]|nr:hypothetical protein [Oscillospiraceae bacterium]